jgi:hypothetical protein
MTAKQVFHCSQQAAWRKNKVSSPPHANVVSNVSCRRSTARRLIMLFEVDTSKQELLCVPIEVLSVSLAP